MTVTEPASFINLDMELESASDLSALARHWKEDVFVLYEGETEGVFRLVLEPLIGGRLSQDATECANHFLKLVISLPTELYVLWGACSSRVFDFGFDGGLESTPIHADICSTTMLQMAQLEIGVRVTVYPFRGEPDAEE